MKSFSMASLGLILATVVAAPATAADFVTKTEVARAGGYDIPLKDGSTARIVDIRPPAKNFKTCRVDIASIKTLAQKAQDRQQYGHVPIRLRARMDGIGNFFCYGQGNGCMVIVMVPTPHA
ncbi:hypothetical protein [Roseovarius sp.]|uniref:hypothetical protein n=1 Tax=Roseovarius sp. TaxID=1486281 RepID=UPI003D09B732